MAHLHSRYSLPSILLIDAAACLGMGVGLVALAGPLAGLMALPAPLLFWAGAILFPVAAYMAAVALWLPGNAPAVMLVILGNVLWVVASLALLAGVVAPNALGVAFLLGQAAFVAVMARLEQLALRAANPRGQEV
ncbi:MAG: hypothetical protein RIA08_11745 [Roseovarius sp.]|uniref:hypothetical protein n=2 Tax=Roseovarius sp. TaxID=1486281 RepID=UPI0032EAE0F6